MNAPLSADTIQNPIVGPIEITPELDQMFANYDPKIYE
jgi:hypothetical protein